MARLERYGPVLDSTISLVEELTNAGKAELRVPFHKQAAGMAVDVQKLLYKFYPFLDTKIYAPTGVFTLTGKPGTKRLHLSVVFDGHDFDVPDVQSFSGYSTRSAIDLEEREKNNIKYESKLVVGASTSSKRQKFGSRFGGLLGQIGITLPYGDAKVALKFSYASLSDFIAWTDHQNFDLHDTTSQYVAEFPVSELDEHFLSYNAWAFFMQPVFWDSWSQYLSIALNRMCGSQGYEYAKNDAQRENIRKRAKSAEKGVVRIIKTINDKRDLDEVAEALGCPPEYRSFYLSKVLRSIGWLCNPDSLSDPIKYKYLQAFSTTCAKYGLEITPNELTKLPEKRAKVK